ncbi:MAG: CPBP family intramembrane metalloprotease, partial [Bacteroidales bacterium]|nr:CPBP family intramembrane metalloprotease [Bacteroidales bacterium]
GYEFLFRGILLFLSLPILGYWPAIFLNVSFYAFVHVPKGAKETIACIPLGFVLCVLTLETGTILIAFFTHLALALSNEYFSIYFNKKMYVKGLKS